MAIEINEATIVEAIAEHQLDLAAILALLHQRWGTNPLSERVERYGDTNFELLLLSHLKRGKPPAKTRRQRLKLVANALLDAIETLETTPATE